MLIGWRIIVEYSLFEKIIIKRSIFFVIGCLIVLIVATLAMRYMFKNMRGERVLFYVLVVLCSVAIIFSVVLSSNILYNSIYDIKNKAYIVYNGEFQFGNTVENYSGSGFLYIPNENGIKLETDAYALEPGNYNGKIVYGEKTRVVLKIETEGISKDYIYYWS